MVKAVFLDRDGVINRSFVENGKPLPPRRVEDFHILPGVAPALDCLKANGFLIVVATNQPDIAQGLMTANDLDAIHRMMRASLPQIDDVRVCLHTKHDGCPCHKPKPGLLLDAAQDWNIGLAHSFMIGDRWRDIGAGQAAGCLTGFIDLGYQEPLLVQPTFMCRDLADAVPRILTLASGETMTVPAISLASLSVKIYADGADLEGIRALAAQSHVKGFTTNPSLMRKAGVTDYKTFALEVLKIIGDRPVSYEVFADDLPTMLAQAKAISSWGDNVYTKIPVLNTKGESTAPIIAELSKAGVKLNVTAILTLEQVAEVAAALDPAVPSVVSVFAGRIADTGRDPVPMMQAASALLSSRPQAELLWASTREVINLTQADASGCRIITVPNDILGKLGALGRDLTDYSIDTVRTFYKDAQSSGYTIAI